MPVASAPQHVMTGHTTLAGVRDALAQRPGDPRIVDQVEAILRRCGEDPASVNPYLEMREILEILRRLPPNEERLDAMVALMRTLGRPEALATYLDALRFSVERGIGREREASRARLLSVKMHSIYGWCGNTLIVESLDHPTQGTVPAPDGLAERLGNAAAAWNLTIHIWQPNKVAKGFPASEHIRSDAILEPPHGHPFDFLSTVVKGAMHQSLYGQGESETAAGGYYAGIPLERVDGVWPPHAERETVMLHTLEHRVRLQQGDLYYMPCHWLHDVEIDAATAASQPTVTLFLSTEYMAMPQVFMTPGMVDFHKAHPDVKARAKPISEQAWGRKIAAIAGYLRNDQPMLDLNPIVAHDYDYAFFHLRQNR